MREAGGHRPSWRRATAARPPSSRSPSPQPLAPSRPAPSLVVDSIGGRRTLSQEPPRIARDGADPVDGQLLAQAARVLGPRLPGRGRLHGPGQLGHRHRRRRPVRLHAAQRDHAVEPDGDPAAGAGRAAGRRHELRPGAGLPRLLLQARSHGALGAGRDRHRGVRPGGGDRLGGGAEPALRHPARRRGHDHGLRRPDRAGPPAAPLPHPRGHRPHPDSRNRGRIRVRAVPVEAGPGRRAPRLRAERRRSCATPRCSTSPSASSAPR